MNPSEVFVEEYREDWIPQACRGNARAVRGGQNPWFTPQVPHAVKAPSDTLTLPDPRTLAQWLFRDDG